MPEAEEDREEDVEEKAEDVAEEKKEKEEVVAPKSEAKAASKDKGVPAGKGEQRNMKWLEMTLILFLLNSLQISPDCCHAHACHLTHPCVWPFVNAGLGVTLAVDKVSQEVSLKLKISAH